MRKLVAHAKNLLFLEGRDADPHGCVAADVGSAARSALKGRAEAVALAAAVRVGLEARPPGLTCSVDRDHGGTCTEPARASRVHATLLPTAYPAVRVTLSA
jgi:hypothetical protein